MTSRPFTIVIYGASGLTGEFVIKDLVQYLSRSRDSVTWAAAGRNESKVRATLASIGTRIGANLDAVPVLTASAEDPDSLNQLARQAVLLINCTGPFRFLGEPVVAACVKNGCHYVDVSGEPQFMETIQLKYQKEATEKGVFVVCGCGLDSIPCDVGVNYLRDSFKGTVNSVESYLLLGGVTGHSTTWDCAVEGFADVDSLVKVRRKLFARQFAMEAKERPKFPIKRKGIHKVNEPAIGLRGYAMSFPGADRSVVKRSQMANQQFFGERMIQMEAYVVQSLSETLTWILMALWVRLLAGWVWGRGLLKRYPRFFTCGMFRRGGPSAEEIDAGSFEILFKGRGWREGEDREKEPSHEIVTKLSGPHPGYPACAICVNQAALTVIKEHERMPCGGGVHTPGTAFRKTSIVERLQANGIKFAILSNDS